MMNGALFTETTHHIHQPHASEPEGPTEAHDVLTASLTHQFIYLFCLSFVTPTLGLVSRLLFSINNGRLYFFDMLVIFWASVNAFSIAIISPSRETHCFIKQSPFSGITMNIRVSHFISDHGSPYRAQTLHKPSPDQRKKNNDHATFSQNFIGGVNSSIKYHRYASHHSTNNDASTISHMITLVALGSLIGTTIAASPSDFFSSTHNPGRRSSTSSAFSPTNPQIPVRQPPLPIVGVPRSTRRPRRFTEEHNGAVFRESPTITYERPDRKNLAPPQPPQQSPSILQRPKPILKQRIDQHTELIPSSPSKTRSIRAIEWGEMKTRAGFLIELWFNWVRDLKNQRLANIELEREQQEASWYAFRFDPTTQNSHDFSMTYLKDAFKRHGLPESAIHKRIAAKMADTRKMDGLDILLRPKQLQPVEYYTSWTPLEIATGANLKEVKKYAGEMAANRGRYVVFWPDSYARSLRNIITQKENGIWSAYTEFMIKSLDAGPLVDQAKTNIDAMVADILMDYYQDFPQLALDIDNVRQHIRRVSYQDVDVADVFSGPGRIAGTDVLFSMTHAFPPTMIDATGASLLQNPLFQNAIRQGLPLKMVASLGASLFLPYTKGKTYHRWVTPHLTFSEPGKAWDVLWIAYKDKFKSDIDFSIFSPTEQNYMLGLGLTKSTIKAATMVFGPALSPWLLNAANGAAAIPDALAATIVDDPKETQAYIRHFLGGILIQSIGAIAYVGNRILIKLEVSKATATLMADPAKKDLEIAKLLKWAKEKILIAAPISTISSASPKELPTAVTTQFLKRSTSQESTATPLSVMSNTLTTDAVDTPLPTTPDALNAEQKLIILPYIIARAEILSYKDSAALITNWGAEIITAFTNASSKTPKEQFDTLSLAAQKFSALKYALIHQGSALNHAEALTFGKEKYGQPITPDVIDMVYFYALEPWLQKQANDTYLNRRALEHPSDILRSACALNTPQRITVFLDSLEENVLFKSTVDNMRAHPAPSMSSEILAFSLKQIDTFLLCFDETALPQPGYLYSQAMLHEYRRRLALGEGWHFNHHSPIANIVADYKRTLGIDQVIMPIALQVLHKLHYNAHDRMALSGFDERYLDGLRNERKLNAIPGYRQFNDQQRLSVFKRISTITAIPLDHPLSSVLASAARILTLFADPADLAKVNYTGGDNALFNQLVGLDLAASNNVGEIDPEWSADFWKLIENQRDIPGVEQWLYKLKFKYFRRERDLTIATINSLYQMAKAEPGRWVTPEMIELAIPLAQHTLIPYIDGDSAQTRIEAIDAYLTHVMGEQAPPQSPQGWWDLLETEPTSWAIASNTNATTPLHQTAVKPSDTINRMLTRAIRIIGPEKFPGVVQSQLLSRTLVQEDPLAVARLLIQSGVKGVTTRTGYQDRGA